MVRGRRGWVAASLPLLALGALGWYTYREVRQANLDNELVAAVDSNDIARVRVLLDRGADPNTRPQARAPSPWQRTVDALQGRRRPVGPPVLAAASEKARWAVADALVRAGATPDVRLGSPPPADCRLAMVVWERWSGPGGSGSQMAPRWWVICPDVFPRRPTERPDAGWPLVRAIEDGRRDSVRLLLDHGADANGRQEGVPGLPLRTAVCVPDVAAAELLLSRGADPAGCAGEGHWHGSGPLIDQVSDPALRRLLLQAEADWRRRHPERRAPQR